MPANTVYRPMKIRTVFSKTDWLGVKNTAVTCGTYQFNNGKKKQLWGIILYIRLIQKIEIFLEKWKIIVICLFPQTHHLKTPQDRFLEIKPTQTTLSFQPVQNIIYNNEAEQVETGNVGGFQSVMRLGKKVRRLSERSAYFEYHIYL